MVKGRLLDDTFEQLVELGQSTAKKTVKSVAQTFNPLSVLDTPDANETGPNKSRSDNPEKMKKNNSTPLDFEKLKNKFQDNDKAQTEALRNRLFQMVKQGDEKVLAEKKQEELQKKRQEEYEKEEKKRREEQQQQEISAPLPMGKIRKSIFNPKRSAERQHAETKPSTGKQ
ncbi:hypothetical protein H3C65_04340 [Patescibacteria group bacterium]|nr:hypothetical protein [Patescibacteria group bacterium]